MRRGVEYGRGSWGKENESRWKCRVLKGRWVGEARDCHSNGKESSSNAGAFEQRCRSLQTDQTSHLINRGLPTNAHRLGLHEQTLDIRSACWSCGELPPCSTPSQHSAMESPRRSAMADGMSRRGMKLYPFDDVKVEEKTTQGVVWRRVWHRWNRVKPSARMMPTPTGGRSTVLHNSVSVCIRACLRYFCTAADTTETRQRMKPWRMDTWS